MITHRKVLNANKNYITLRPFGDLQFGTAGFQEWLWKRWLKETIDDPTAVVIGLGDYSDSFRPTIQKRLKAVFIDDASAGVQMDEMLMEQMQRIAERLKPIQGKIVGLLEGHHYYRFNNSDITTTQYLCQLLKVKYLGFVSCIQLILRVPGDISKALDIFATHGSGGAKLSSTDASRLERDIMPYWDADIFLRGHSTKVYTMPAGYLNKFSSGTGTSLPLFIKKRNRLLVNTGGFMEGYVEGQSSYVEEKGLPGSALGYATIEVRIVNTNTKGDRERVFEMRPTIITP